MQSDAVIYAVVGADRARAGDPGGPAGSWQSQPGFLKNLAEQTGGTKFQAGPHALSDVFAGIVAEMKARYLLTFYPREVSLEGVHRLDVKLKGRRGTVRARRGYVAAQKVVVGPQR
jgi:hypothetical protein